MPEGHCGYEFKEALQYAAEYTGIAPESYKPKEMPPKTPEKPQGFSDKQKEMIAYAKTLEKESTPIKGTLAEEYLREHRGITAPIPDSFKFNIAVKEPETQRYLPALIVVAKDKEGQTQAVQCIFLDIRTANKASIETPKRTYGPLKDASVLIQQGKGRVALAEGPETALSVASADATLTVYATLGIANMAKIPLSDTITKVTLCADNDGALSPSDKMLRKAAEALSKRGIDVHVAKPKKIDQDFNDVLIEKGAPEVLRNIKCANCVKSAEPFEFKEKIEAYREIPDNHIITKAKMHQTLEVMADGIKNDPLLTEAAKRYGVYASVSSYASSYQQTVRGEIQSQEILAELKSKDPIQEYIRIAEQKKEIPEPWLNNNPEQKTEWHRLDNHLNKLGFAIDKDISLSAQAIEQGIHKDVKNKSSNYYITLRDQQERDRGIGR